MAGGSGGVGVADKNPIFQTEFTWANLALGRIIIDQDMAVAWVGETGEFGPASQRVVDGFAQSALRQDGGIAARADPAVLPQSGLGKAIDYALARWPELTRFADPGYGHILIDNNPTERQIRPSKLGLKNWIFVGHPDAGDRPAILYSVLGTCKLLGVNPWAYLNWALPGLAAATNHTQALFSPDKFPGIKV